MPLHRQLRECGGVQPLGRVLDLLQQSDPCTKLFGIERVVLFAVRRGLDRVQLVESSASLAQQDVEPASVPAHTLSQQLRCKRVRIAEGRRCHQRAVDLGEVAARLLYLLGVCRLRLGTLRRRGGSRRSLGGRSFRSWSGGSSGGCLGVALYRIQPGLFGGFCSLCRSLGSRHHLRASASSGAIVCGVARRETLDRIRLFYPFLTELAGRRQSNGCSGDSRRSLGGDGTGALASQQESDQDQ